MFGANEQGSLKNDTGLRHLSNGGISQLNSLGCLIFGFNFSNDTEELSVCVFLRFLTEIDEQTPIQHGSDIAGLSFLSFTIRYELLHLKNNNMKEKKGEEIHQRVL